MKLSFTNSKQKKEDKSLSLSSQFNEYSVSSNSSLESVSGEERMMKGWVLAIALGLTFLLLFGVPIIFSEVTGVPLSFLLPVIQLSIPGSGTMVVTVNPIKPGIVGQSVVVTVIDAGNKTPIAGASVKIVFNGYDYYNTTTNSDGTAQFEYPGATTIVYVSKDGYQDAAPIPLPQIPESWVTVRNYQMVTWILGLLGSWGPALYLYKKQGAKLPTRRKRK